MSMNFISIITSTAMIETPAIIIANRIKSYLLNGITVYGKPDTITRINNIF